MRTRRFRRLPPLIPPTYDLRQILDDIGLPNWELKYNNDPLICGSCEDGLITISDVYADIYGKEILLHEAAHAFVGPEHSKAWEKCVVELGGKPKTSLF